MKYTSTNHTKMRDLSDNVIGDFYYSCLETPMNIYFNGGLHKQFNDVVELFLALQPKAKKEIHMLIYHIAQAIKNSNKGFVVCLNNEVFNKARKDGCEVSYSKTTNLLESLVNNGYGVLYIGDSEKQREPKYKSVFILSDKLKALFTSKNISKYPKKVKDNSWGKVILDSENTRGVRPIQKNLNTINGFLYEEDIMFRGNKITPKLNRIFGNSLVEYGRFYFLAQTMKSEYRKEIVMSSEVVTELDFSSHHARICAELAGVKLDKTFKPYLIDKPELVTSVPVGGDPREVFKLGMMCLLNCKGLHHKALSNAWVDRLSNYGGVANSQEIIRELKRTNSSFIHEVRKQDAGKLQYVDSCILEKIMLSLVSHGIPFLPYHDSIVVPLSSREVAKEFMYKAWRDVLGSNYNCVVDIKF